MQFFINKLHFIFRILLMIFFNLINLYFSLFLSEIELNIKKFIKKTIENN